MSAEAQHLIQRVRAQLSAEDYSKAQAILRDAPTDRSRWTQQERDEVLCLEEFLNNLNSPLCLAGSAE
jgi:hypothetical protein